MQFFTVSAKCKSLDECDVFWKLQMESSKKNIIVCANFAFMVKSYSLLVFYGSQTKPSHTLFLKYLFSLFDFCMNRGSVIKIWLSSINYQLTRLI